MIYSELSGKELSVIRRILMLEVSESAEWIGVVDARTWRYWESGRNKVPQHIVQKISELLKVRDRFIGAFMLTLKDGDSVRFYSTFEEWVSDKRDGGELQWKAWQSAVSQIFTSNINIKLL